MKRILKILQLFYKKRIIFFIIFFFINYSFSQNSTKNPVTNDGASKEVVALTGKLYSSTDEALKRETALFKVAKNDNDRYFIYQWLADLKRKQRKYLDAVKLYEKADYYLEKSDKKTPLELIYLNVCMGFTLKNAGMLSDADAKWEKARTIAKQIKKVDEKEVHFMLLQIDIFQLKEKQKFCKTISVYKEILSIIQKDKKIDQIMLPPFWSDTAYMEMKCGNLQDAKKYLDSVEVRIHSNKDKKTIDGIESYYFAKGYYFYLNKDEKEASNYFSNALQIAKSRNNFKMVKTISEEAVKCRIEIDPNQKIDFGETLIDFNNKKESESSKISAYNISLKNTIIGSQQRKIITSVLVIFSLIATIAFIFYWNRKQKRIVEERFQTIISRLEKKQHIPVQDTKAIPIINPGFDSQNSNPESNELREAVRPMSEIKEKELLQKFKDFETGNEFTSKNFTISNFSTLLESNTRYINYILSEHKKMAFNQYINHLRIQYIIQKLYDEPAFRSYKISYLSDYCGFANHSHFTPIFKKEVNMSPSQFIAQLQKNA